MRKYLLSVLVGVSLTGLAAWLVVSTIVIRSWQDDQRVAHIAIVIVKQYNGIFGLKGMGIDDYGVFVGSVANLAGLVAAAIFGLGIGLAISMREYLKLHRSVGR